MAFREDLIDRVKGVIRPKEGSCGICHAVVEEICALGGGGSWPGNGRAGSWPGS